MAETPQAALVRLASEQGVSLSALSRMVGRNVAYLQQFATRGSPRALPERERGALAAFFGVEEELLGRVGDRGDEAAIRYLDVVAAAGGGRSGASERVRRVETLSRAQLVRLGVDSARASMIDVAGDSMAPTLLDGDRLLVDLAATRVPRGGGVFVIRLGDDLLVKRVTVSAGAMRITSDNPAYAPRDVALADVVTVGRARLLLRGL